MFRPGRLGRINQVEDVAARKRFPARDLQSVNCNKLAQSCALYQVIDVYKAKIHEDEELAQWVWTFLRTDN